MRGAASLCNGACRCLSYNLARLNFSTRGPISFLFMTWTDWMTNGGWRALDVVPMVPTVAREVLELSTDPDVSIQRIAHVVRRDPVLTSRVLQLANSAYSASGVEITSSTEAIARIGTHPTRNLVTAVCVASLLSHKGTYGDRARELIDHGIGTAYIASFLAEATGDPRDEAFVGGLLHDIGKLLIEQMANRPPKGVPRPAHEEVATVLAARHAPFGGDLLRWWKLPAPLADVVTCHHDPQAAEAGTKTAAVVYAANRLAHRYGFGCEQEEFDPLGDPVFADIHLEAAVLARIDRQAPKMYEMARQLSV
jgi:putative nucleotidyltransferase with HDIG domain